MSGVVPCGTAFGGSSSVGAAAEPARVAAPTARREARATAAGVAFPGRFGMYAFPNARRKRNSR